VETECFCGRALTKDSLVVAFRHAAGDLMVQVWNTIANRMVTGRRRISRFCARPVPAKAATRIRSAVHTTHETRVIDPGSSAGVG